MVVSKVLYSDKDNNMSTNTNGIYIVKSNIGNLKIVLIK